MNQENRYIFIPQITNYGGIERNVIALSNHLTESRLEHEVVTFYSDIDLNLYSDHLVPLVQLTRSSNQFWKAYLLKRKIQGARYMPLLFGIKGAFNLGLFSPGACVLHFTDPPSLLMTGSSSFGLIGRLRERVAHYFTNKGCRRAHKMITMTTRNRTELLNVYGVDSIVLPQGGRPPVGELRQRRGSGAEMTLLSVCRLENSKRVDWIIKSLAILCQSGHSFRLSIVGEGAAEHSLRQLVKNLGVQDKVSFLGPIGNLELEQVFAESDIFVMPAVQGFGLPALEALYRLRPVVLHKDSGVSEVLSENAWATVFTGEISNMVEAIIGVKKKIETNSLVVDDLKFLPTERWWSHQIVELCGWGK